MLAWIKRLFRKRTVKPKPRYTSIAGFKYYTPLEQLHNDAHPAVITPDGYHLWYRHGRIGRADGPSVETPAGSRYWFDGQELHRTDGPAVEHSSGMKLFYLNGRELSFEDWLKRTELPKEKKVELALIYS